MSKTKQQVISVFLIALAVFSLCAMGLSVPAHADYAATTARIEVQGTGTYVLTPANQNEQARTINIDRVGGKQYFELTYTAPGAYNYVLTSKDSAQTKKTAVNVTVTVNDKNQLEPIVVCRDMDSGTKLQEIVYATPAPGSIKTGDSSHPAIYLAGIAMSLIGIGAVSFYTVRMQKAPKQKGE